MEAIREYLEKPLYAGIAGFVLGLIIGWFVIGWGIWPVAWTDGAPADLRADVQADYLTMAIESYSLTFDSATAKGRWEELGEGAADVLAAVEAAPGHLDATAIQNFRAAVEAQPEQAEEPEEDGGGLSTTTLLLICLVVVIVVGGFAGYYLYRQRREVEGEATPAVQAQEITRQAERTDYSMRGEMPPMSQFMTTYMLGDDLFDDSFSIDSPSGEFLGECGVGISEAIGVGEPKKVAAYEVWLFDKNDIQTVTKVLMSEHAFSDESLRQRLSAKGEPFLAEPGSEMVLETATLRLTARVVDMSYGSGAMPPDSFFERITLELAVWQKE
jgi:hypothetical protein